MKSFKNREKVLTRLQSPLFTMFSTGLRIIVRLYPIPSRQKASKALMYNDLTAFLILPEKRKENGFYTAGARKAVSVNPLLTRLYRLKELKQMLKLCKVLTCELPAREFFACLAFTCGKKTGRTGGVFIKTRNDWKCGLRCLTFA